jgi:uncharacterized protein with PIN domain
MAAALPRRQTLERERERKRSRFFLLSVSAPRPKERRQPRPPVAFLCDAMLGGLARWLRAAGYSAEFDVHAPDGALVRRALAENKLLLTSDMGIMKRYAVTSGRARVLFVPRELDVNGQLGFVLSKLDLPLLQPACMQCGGELAEVPLSDVRDAVPEKVRKHCRRYFACRRCGKLFWHGTHWTSIMKRLKRAARTVSSRQPRRGK